MARTIRFHLDEHCPNAIAEGLRRRGIDVTMPKDVALLGATDAEHLAFARREVRVIFTQDEDFLVAHASGIDHAGIAFCSQESHSIGEIIAGLVLIWEVYESDEVLGKLEWL